MRIYPHSDKPELINWTPIPVGKVVLGLKGKHILTKTLTNKVVKVGNSPRFLYEYDIFEYGSVTDGSFLKFQVNQEQQLKLTTVLPNIKLTDISGIVLSDYSGYLGVNVAGQIINIAEKTFTVGGMSDVTDNTYISNYVLTFRNGIYNLFSGEWEFKPETSTFTGFDDVQDNNGAYRVPVNYFASINQGGFGNEVRVLDLEIKWDKAPILGGDLNANGKSLVYQLYDSNYVTANTTVASFDINLDSHKETIIETAGCQLLEIKISTSGVYSGVAIAYHILTVRNFAGIINFKVAGDILYENGIPPNTTIDGNMVLGLMAYLDGGKIRVMVLEKSNNATKFRN